MCTLADFDACQENDCIPLSSKCIDLAPPSMSYKCDCLSGFSGEPGDDGSGCGKFLLPIDF